MKYIKHPRIYHLPFSPGVGKEDRILDNLYNLQSNIIVVLLKLDGENTSLYRDYIHARSLTFTPHPSRNWLKAYHQQIKHIIPEGWRICGENMYAKHSIYYKNLDSYFYVHSIWDENNICLSWRETDRFCRQNNLALVPVFYIGPWDIRELEKISKLETYNEDEVEGFVVRTLDKIPYLLYNEYVAKWVRANHIKTDIHWRHTKIEKNLLRNV